MEVFRRCAKALFINLLLSLPLLISAGAVSAQSVVDRYNRIVRDSSTVTALGNDLFGEQVDTLDGQTSFHVVDVSLPTNSGLPVAFARRLDVTGQYTDEEFRGFGPSMLGKYWFPDVPYMNATFDMMRGWVGRDPNNPQYLRSATQNRCSQMDLGPPPTNGVAYFLSVEYTSPQFFSGIHINIPGAGREQIVKQAPVTIGGKLAVAKTRSHWQVSCLPSLKNGTGEGFEVLLPDGTRYQFDWMFARMAPSLMDTNCRGNATKLMISEESNRGYWQPEVNPNNWTCTESIGLPRAEVFLFATKVIDRFGNSVDYEYEEGTEAYDWVAGVPSRFRLKSIRSSDNVSLTMGYDAGGRLSTVTADGRVWQYIYDGEELRSVTLPGANGSWNYQYGANILRINDFQPQVVWRGCRFNLDTKTTAANPSAGETNAVTIKHPSGASGLFEFRRILHGTKQSEPGCSWVGGDWFNKNGYQPMMQNPSAYQAASLYRKTISGPGLPSMVWNYTYQPGWEAPYRSVTTVTDSQATRLRYTYGTDCYYNLDCPDYGLLFRLDTEKGAQTLRSEVYEYQLTAQGQTYPAQVGTMLNFSGRLGYGRSFNFNRPLVKTTIIQQGRQFVSEVDKGCNGAAGAYCFDSLVRPLKVVKTSAPYP